MNLNELYKQAKPEISVSTIKTYISDIKQIAKLFDITLKEESDLKNLLSKSSEDVLTKLSEKYSNEKTRRNKLNSLVVLANHMGYNDLYKELSHDRDNKNNSIKSSTSNNLTEKEEQNYVTTEEYKAMLNNLEKQLDMKDKSKHMENLIQNFIILTIYFHIPLRADLADVELCKSDSILDTGNCIVQRVKSHKRRFKSRYTLFLRQYKTAKSIGDQKIPIPEILNKYLDSYFEQDRNYLLLNNRGEPMSPNSLTRRFPLLFEEYMDKHFTINLNRKRIISESKDMKEYNKLRKEIEKQAKKAGHSIELHTSNIYNKNV